MLVSGIITLKLANVNECHNEKKGWGQFDQINLYKPPYQKLRLVSPKITHIAVAPNTSSPLDNMSYM